MWALAAEVSVAHVHPNPTALALFLAANVIIGLGYLTIAVGWVRFLRYARTPRSRWAMAAVAGFFGGCVGTHIMVLQMPHASWFWVVWHAVQAVCTWGSIVLGSLILRDAWKLWCQWAKEAEALAENTSTAPPPPEVQCE